MHVIENDFLRVEVGELGAELRVVYDKKLNKNRMWSGNADLWARVSPVLFPIVGKLKDGYYRYQDKRYELSQHGFLRDQNFNLELKTEDRLVFNYSSDKDLLKVYPFKHQVKIEYTINKSTLQVSWFIKNLESKDMYYSIGAHPGFSLDDSNDYEIIFPNEGVSNRYELKEGLLDNVHEMELETMDLKLELFKNDAIIYDDISSVILQAKDKSESVQVNFTGFPFVGLWSVYEAVDKLSFVCIEPWHGIVDEFDSKQDLTEKLGIRHLDGFEEEKLEYEMIFNET